MAILSAFMLAVLLYLSFKQRALRQANKWYEQTVYNLPYAIMVVDAKGIIVSINHVAEKLSGWTKDEVVGQHYSLIYAAKSVDGLPLDNLVHRVLNTEPKQLTREKVILTTKTGEEVIITDKLHPILDSENRIEGVLWCFRDLSKDEINHEHIQQLSFKDGLTGLYNRTYYKEILPSLVQEENLPLSIMVGDLDGLKLTNDIFGHAIGDELIKLVGDTLKETCRPQDLLFRWGGDEFIVILPRTTYEETVELRETLYEKLLNRKVGLINPHLPLGIATRTDVDEELGFTLQQADEEMYWLKTVGSDVFQQKTLGRIQEELFARSANEKEHAEQVSALAVEFGEYLGLPEPELRKLRIAGYLHDIGKVALDPELLHKPFPLESKDQHEMQRHPLVGFRLLNFFDETVDLADAVLAHHERWDGKGYPKGLKGYEIPLLGRILAIIETYDRVLHYPYKRSYTEEEAQEVIVDGADGKFDPSLVKAFIELLRSKSEVEVP